MAVTWHLASRFRLDPDEYEALLIAIADGGIFVSSSKCL
jgi:hypothetical protein